MLSDQETLDYLARLREQLEAEEFDDLMLGRTVDSSEAIKRGLAHIDTGLLRWCLLDREELNALQELKLRRSLEELFSWYPPEVVLGGEQVA